MSPPSSAPPLDFTLCSSESYSEASVVAPMTPPQSTPPPIRFSSTSPKYIDPTSPWNFEEARCFLQDLKNFIALGSLTLSGPGLDSSDAPLWSEVYRVYDAWDLENVLKDGLNRLCSAGWIRVFAQGGLTASDVRVLRIYLLPNDTGNRFVDRRSKRLASALENLLKHIDVSSETWLGERVLPRVAGFDRWSTADDRSLFYLFNSIPSPAPGAERVDTHHNREALVNLLGGGKNVPQMRTSLYPYQRRSAGLMLERESSRRLCLDPRLEMRKSPDGSPFYYGARDLVFLRHPRLYETGKGGILAETMGLGKTLICIALILSTKGHLPAIPAQYDRLTTRAQVGSLVDMVITSINRNSVPWKKAFETLETTTGESMAHCIDLLQSTPPSYEIPQIPQRWNRNTTIPPPKKLTLAPTTIIVVPRNLCSQWQSELQKHVDDGALSILLMDDLRKELPPPDAIRNYDIVLFSRSRFEQEARDGADEKGRRMPLQKAASCLCPYIGATRKRDCTCLRSDDVYESPLKHLHFLRIIIDEGHFFSNSNSIAAQVANRLVEADHRWVVSGTPARDLLGVEMDLYASDATPLALNDGLQRDRILDQRRKFSNKDDTSGAVKSIGGLASQFLKIRPWAGNEEESSATWDDYVYRHEDSRRRTYSGFSIAFSRTLEALVIKTQPESVERDINLPPLTHNIVRLQPSFYDKLTANLFTFVLTANAVTSERTDADYLFHKNSQKARYQLIHNLRQSAFFWTGFSQADITAAIKHGESYLEKDDTSSTDSDRRLLRRCMEEGRLVLGTAGWKSLSSTHEIGVFLDDWPRTAVQAFTFDGRQPLLTGATQLLEAQSYVHGKAGSPIGDELWELGWRLRQNEEDVKPLERDGENPVLAKLGIPSSSMSGEPSKKRSTVSTTGKRKRQSILPRYQVAKRQKTNETARKSRYTEEQAFADPLSDRASAAKLNLHGPTSLPEELPKDSELRKTRIVGTTSAKLSYLASEVLKYYQQEKILIFYEGDNVAYYIAQVLEMLHIPHLIYAKSLNPAQKSEYVVHFDQDSHFRVLLMDVQQAAFGLNLSSASRVFFINPVCRPHIEAQAIKRAHRIGQTRPVVVETLILEGTVEEQMFERAKRMSRTEHKQAKVLEDDGGITKIIQSARPLPVYRKEKNGYGQVAYLEEPQRLWNRPGWADWDLRKDQSRPVQDRATGKRRNKGTMSRLGTPQSVTVSENYEGGKAQKQKRVRWQPDGDPHISVLGARDSDLGQQAQKTKIEAVNLTGQSTSNDFASSHADRTVTQTVVSGSDGDSSTTRLAYTLQQCQQYMSIFGGAGNEDQ